MVFDRKSIQQGNGIHSASSLLYYVGMNVYFTASIVGKKHHLVNYQRIISLLQARGATVQSEHVMKSTEATIRLETKIERLAFHKRLEEWINACDCMVAETTFPSISVGYEISLALQRNKPVLILYSEGDPPSLLTTQHEEKIICEQYSLETLKDEIDEFLTYVEGNADTRFTFFITSSIASYLEKISKKQKIPKSVYIRNLILKDMKESV